MKRIFTLTVLGLFGYTTTHAQCVETPVNKVILAGDSWAAFMNGDQTINDGLKNVGHSDKKFVSSVVISENGADTWDFVQGSKPAAIQDMVDANPEVSIIHMSIGGNDMLGDWHVSFSQQETDSLATSVKYRLDSIVDFLQGTRQGMNVFWPGYTYPNFEEVLDPFGSIHPFYSTWNDMGQPNFLEINTVLNEMSDSVLNSASLDPYLHFVPAQGVLQYHYGQAQPLGVAPGGTYAALDAPLPYGYPNYPSPMVSMRDYVGIFTDCFHLSPEAYLIFFQYQAERYYQKALMDDLYLLSEGGDEDGSVSASGTVSQEIKLGEDSGDEIAAVLTFDTQAMADTILEGASIFLRRQSLSGTNPFVGNTVQVKMINGNFGTTANVEAEDFTASGDASGDVCKFGSFQQDGHWVRIDLDSDMLANISNDAPTQFVISIPGFTGGVMTFNDATDPVYAPVLNLKYYTCTVNGTDTQTACNSYQWINGQTYTSSNNSATYTYHNGAVSGCDSIVTLDLTLTTVNTDVDVAGATLTANLSGAEYQWLDCDNGNAPINGETGQSFTATEDGNYAVAVTADGCTDVSNCVNMNLSGISHLENSRFKVYPNPTEGMLRIESTDANGLADAGVLKIEVFNLLGKLVLTPAITQSTVDISGLTNGTYVLRITTDSGVSAKRIIKR